MTFKARLSAVALVVTIVGGLAIVASALILGFLTVPCSWCCFYHPGVVDPGGFAGLGLEAAPSSGPACAPGWYGTGVDRNLAVATLGLAAGIAAVVLGVLIFWKEKLLLVSGVGTIIAAIVAFPVLDGIYVVASIIALVGGILAIVSWKKNKPFPP